MLNIGLVASVIFDMLLGLWLRRQSPVLWKFHPAIKEGHKYVVKAIYFECLDLKISRQRCAVLQDEYGLYKPFQVFFPSKE